jgi:hypothetical protein
VECLVVIVLVHVEVHLSRGPGELLLFFVVLLWVAVGVLLLLLLRRALLLMLLKLLLIDVSASFTSVLLNIRKVGGVPWGEYDKLE